MRNIFDQYSQPENQLTHALACTLFEDAALMRPFLEWLGVKLPPHKQQIKLVEQRLPGNVVEDWDEQHTDGLPDMFAYTEEGWGALFESKVQSGISTDQLKRHRKTAAKHDFPDAVAVVISVDQPSKLDSEDAIFVEWRDVYAWFRSHRGTSAWARRLTDYMEVFESKMITQGYGIRGTITMFDGLKFDGENPYNYREAKRLIRLLRDELIGRSDLKELGIDPSSKGRGAITGSKGDAVWDFISLRGLNADAYFTAYPHLTLNVARKHVSASITVPNGIKGGFRTKLRQLGEDGFLDLLDRVETYLRPVVAKSKFSTPRVYAVQRHHTSIGSPAYLDARVEADLRTASRHSTSPPKTQPEWIESIYRAMVNKRSNIQMGVSMAFDYRCPLVRSPEAVDLFAESWICMKPVVDFLLASATAH